MFDWMKKGLPHPSNLPEGLGSLKDEIERQVRAVVQGLLSRMDLVTRDELDVQLNVLMRTREKLEALETRLTALEAANPATSSSSAQAYAAGAESTHKEPVHPSH